MAIDLLLVLWNIFSISISFYLLWLSIHFRRIVTPKKQKKRIPFLSFLGSDSLEEKIHFGDISLYSLQSQRPDVMSSYNGKLA